MPNFSGWDSPELPSSSEEDERQYLWDIMKTGFRFVAFSIFLYTLIIWGFSNLLMKSNILSGDISWAHAGILSAGIIILRVWDKTFFK